MKIQSLLISLCALIALNSCDSPEVFEPAPSISIQAQSNSTINTNDGVVVLDLSSKVSTSGDVNLSYTWNVNDGSAPIVSNSAVLNHQFMQDGTYVVDLVVTDTNGGADSKTMSFTVVYESSDSGSVPSLPEINLIEYSSNAFEVSFSADISAQSTQDILYTWDFGDGNSDDVKNPVHTYAAANTYSVKLIIYNTNGVLDTKTQNVIVSANLNTAPSAVISNITNDYLTIDVSAVGSIDPEGAQLNYTWNFGDGTIIQNAGVSVSHTYSFAGEFPVTVIVSDGEFSATASQSVTVVADPAAKPAYYSLFEEAYFEFLSQECAACHYSGSGMSRFSMGLTQDGISIVTAELGLIALLNNPDGFDKVIANPIEGENNHLLTISGSDEQTWRALIEQMRTFIAIENNQAPVAVISTPITIDGLNVVVDGSKSSDADNDNLTYVWTFDGKTTMGAMANIAFETSGVKTIKLTVSDGKGGLHSTTQNVSLVKPNSAPNPAFQFTTNLLSASFDASMSMDEEGDDFTYAWDFGDGNVLAAGNQSMPTHTYLSEGNYTVTLTLADANGSKSIDKSLSVSMLTNTAPVADFNVTVNNLMVSLASTSTDADGDDLTYEWVIDGNVVADMVLSSHIFDSSGEKSITLNVRDARGETDSITKTVIIENQGPTASFSVSKNFTSVTFDASGSLDPENDDLTYTWNFGDSQTDTGINPTHTFANAGSYDVELIVNDGNKQNSIVRVIDVSLPENSAPRALFTYSKVDNTYTFNGSNSSDADGDDLTYAWDFDDGQTDIGVNVTHTFVGEADFNVTLTVSDGDLSGLKTIKVSTIPKLEGNPVTGETLYNQQCLSCHQEFGVGVQGLYDAIAINRYLDGQADLFEKIDTTMPPTNIAACSGQCASDIEAYMLTWEREIVSYSCPAEKIDATKYGPRQMRLLTIEEYVNTVKDLFGYDVDRSKLIGNSKIHEFNNHTKTEVDFNRFKAFEALAQVIADDAALTDFVNVKGAGNCIASGDCSGAFTGEVLPRAYRRPITEAEETMYQSAFDNRDSGTEGSAVDGMHLAVRTMLMSPYFLYRSELGMSKTEFDAYILNAPPMYKSTTTPVSRPMTDFGAYHPGGSKATTQLDHNVDWQITQNFEEGTLVKIRFKGTTSNVVIKAGTQELYSGPSPENYKTMQFLVDGLTGDQVFSIKAPYQNGTSNTLDLLEFSKGEEVEFVVPQMDDNAYALTPYEMATFLAYTYTGSTPDDELLGAASEGLFTDEEVQLQIERLLATDKSKAHFGEFAAQWLTVDAVLTAEKDALLFPTYTDDVRKAMAQEVREIVTEAIFDDSVPFSNLYDSNYTFVNESLASFYGIGGVSGDEFVKATAPGRGGLTTTGAFLSAWATPTESNLIIRGVRLRERFLCQHLPPFPTNIDLGEIRDEQAGEVERISNLNNGHIRQAHLDYINTDVAACKSCHEYIINPLGLGMEDFDAAGLPRTLYSNGLSVDFTGFEPEKLTHQSTLYGIDDIFDSSQSRTFQGAENLGEVLATEDVTRACMIEMSFRYMMGTGPDEFDHDNPSAIVMTDSEREDYTCTTDAMRQKMDANADNPKAALIEFGISDIVRFRKIRNR